MKVLLTWQASDDEIARFKAGLPGATILVQPAARGLSRFDATLASLEPFLGEADAIAGYVLPVGTLDRARNLKMLAWMHAGCDELDLTRLKEMEVRVTNLRGCNSVAVAEHATAIILGLAKRLPMKHRAVVEGLATPVYVPGSQSAMLDGRTLGIVGLGEIGSRVARHAKAFNLRVIGIRRHPEKGANGADEVYGIPDLHRVLGQCDYVLISTPITKDTDQFFGAPELAAMKQGAFLINIARGNLIQEFALYEALNSGKLSGYGADVWWMYNNCFPATYHFPVPSRTGIHKMPNVLGTGDQGGNAEDVLARNIERTIQSLAEFQAGRKLTWGINLDLGY
jgi:phosphoglycerate dehydrogenase-like enzyme